MRRPVSPTWLLVLQCCKWIQRGGSPDPPRSKRRFGLRAAGQETRRAGSRVFVLVITLPLALALGAAAATAAPASPDADALAADLDRILAEGGLGKTVTAVRVLDLGEPGGAARAKTLLRREADRPLIPASNMKLVTTAACFDRFGPDWRIRTHVGRFPSGRGKGKWDLAVIGGGDPNLSGRFWNGDTVGAFRRWARILKARGLTAVERIVLDDTLFDTRLVHPNWPANQRDKWYEAPVSALTINDNCVNVRVAAGGAAGDPARVRLEPPGGGVRLSGGIRTVADRKAHRYSLDRFVDPDGTLRIRAAGGFWLKAPERVEYRTLADPARVFGQALAWTLRQEGIAVAGPVVRGVLTQSSGEAVEGFRCDLIHTSRLAMTAAVANARSQGVYAECLLKLLGAYGQTPAVETPHPPRQGSWQSGRQELAGWLAERGIPAAGCVFDDGSGLSKENRATAFVLTEVLALMHRRTGAGFRNTLAVAGRTGSLAKRMGDTAAEGRIFAKTGYVAGASTLSGYAATASGRLLAFSILMNGFPYGQLWKARLVQDKMCIRMTGY